MMAEITTLGEIIQTFGVATVIVIVALYLAMKIVPKTLEARQLAAAQQQEYYAQRQKQYDDQMGEVIRIAERSTQALLTAHIVTEANTEAFKQNTAVHDKVIEALTRDYEETQAIQGSLAAHDKRLEGVQRDIVRLNERSGIKHET